MSHMSQKDIDEKNAVVDDTIEAQCDECEKWVVPNEWYPFCSRHCFEIGMKRRREYYCKEKGKTSKAISDLFKVENIIHELDEWKDEQVIRNGKTGLLKWLEMGK